MSKGGARPKRCEWDNPRLLTVIEFFGSIPGGELQIKTDELIRLVGLPETALKRYIEWARRYGALEIERPAVMGEGRKPNLYRSVIGLEEWREVGDAQTRKWQESAPRIRVKNQVKGGHAKRLAPPGPLGTAWSRVR